ncbi:MAG TPA: hypothetical protein VGI39_18050 [Polyangiaceae bacterium]
MTARLLFLAALLAALLVGCGRTQVLSSDGASVVRTCSGDDGITAAVSCIAEACPYGMVALPRDGKTFGDPVVRCIPGPKGGPQ